MLQLRVKNSIVADLYLRKSLIRLVGIYGKPRFQGMPRKACSHHYFTYPYHDASLMHSARWPPGRLGSLKSDSTVADLCLEIVLRIYPSKKEILA